MSRRRVASSSESYPSCGARFLVRFYSSDWPRRDHQLGSFVSYFSLTASDLPEAVALPSLCPNLVRLVVLDPLLQPLPPLPEHIEVEFAVGKGASLPALVARLSPASPVVLRSSGPLKLAQFLGAAGSCRFVAARLLLGGTMGPEIGRLPASLRRLELRLQPCVPSSDLPRFPKLFSSLIRCKPVSRLCARHQRC